MSMDLSDAPHVDGCQWPLIMGNRVELEHEFSDSLAKIAQALELRLVCVGEGIT